jgi:hypothetical protein
MKTKSVVGLCCGVALLWSTHPAGAVITLDFDFTYDTSGFFTANPEATGLLTAAATELASRLSDSLNEIPTPTDGSSWNARFNHPATGVLESILNLVVPADTMIVYVGGRDLSGSTAGVAHTAFSFSGTAAFLDVVVKRGQAGATLDAATSTDYGPWGGSIAFDDTDVDWYFDDDPVTVDVPGGKTDFYSVALHELGHLLGVGLANSWDHWIVAGKFTGPVSVAEFGGDVTLEPGPDPGHWEDGTASFIPGTATGQETAMDPVLATGERKFFTGLDFAALDDIGWEVVPVPEPHEYALAAGLALLGFAGYRRRVRRSAEI